ncbi:MAG TPA: hypothetical protein VFA55_02255, partial [Candidatus Kapabacteria bacterium]|nr:hypothetical protein [Candidatus Kapabacteria bacterium]
KTPGPPPPPPPSQNVVTFVKNTSQNCATYLALLDVQADPGSYRIPDTARKLWREARNQYEQMRFAVEEFAPVYHQRIAAWFTHGVPTQGFHYIESLLFGADSSNPNWTAVESASQGAFGYTQANIPSTIGNATVTDSGIFSGLEYMLADIDSIKFSGLDSVYSKNSYNDIFSNYNGLDSVYSYYQSVVRDSSVTTDTLFTGCLQRARVALQNAGSLALLDKNVYNTGYLFPLDTAVKRVAQVIGVRLP